MENTNSYATSIGAGKSGRPWSELSLNELKRWIGVTIYMGVFKAPYDHFGEPGGLRIVGLAVPICTL